MSFRRFSTLFAACLALAGCASSSRNIPVYDGTASVRPVEVFVTSRPTRPYVDRGIIEVRQRAATFPRLNEAERSDDALNRMSRLAASRGCDAVILLGSDNAVSGAMADGSGYIKTQKGFRGSCVVYTGAEKAPAAALAQHCAPNATQLCYGPGACQGAQACLADGTGFTACDCGDAATSTSAPAAASPVATPAPAAAQASTATP